MIQLLLPLLIVAADAAAGTHRISDEAMEVRSWDFEESDDTNFDGWPDGWTRRKGRGYPVYLPIGIAADDPAPPPMGTRCLRIDLDGGSAVAQSPAVRVSPQFSYVLEGLVKTRKLEHDRAFITLTFCDADRQPLEVYQSRRYDDAATWELVQIGPVTPTRRDIEWAVIALHLQPSGEADLRGAALFDDIWLGSLPRMAVEMNSDHNVYTTTDVEVTCRVSGFSEPNPLMRFELLDVFDRLLSVEEKPMKRDFGERDANDDTVYKLPIDADTAKRVFSGSAVWKPRIPGNGYYQVRVSIPGHTGHMFQNLVVIDPQSRTKTGDFGWTLPGGDQPLSVSVLPSLLGQVGINWVKFPVWYDDRDKKRAEDLAWFAERLSSQGIQLVGMLDRPPQTVRDMFGESNPLPVASVFKQPKVWRPAVDPVMTRLSLKVRWWQLGGDRDTSFVNFPNLEEKLNEIREGFNRFGSEINLGMAWRSIDETPVVERPPWSFLSYTADPPLTADELRTYLAAESVEPVRRWVGLDPLSKDEYGLRTRAKDLVVRMLAAKMGKADGIFIPDPFDPKRGLMNEDGSPGPLLLPWRTTALMTSGTEYLGSIQLPQGSRNHVFAKGNEATMFVWNDNPVRETLYLGEHVSQFDLWGRQRRPRIVTQDKMKKHEIEVGTMPVVVTGINPYIAKWRMAFQFETAELASIFGQDQIAFFRFKNTFLQGVGGEITLIPPPRVWEVDPRTSQFKLAPGKVQREGVHVLLGANATSGRQPVPVKVKLTADRTYEFMVYRDIHVGLGDVEVELLSALDEFGNLVVKQYLTNKTDRVVNFNCLLFVPGRRRERRQVFNLGRGGTTNVFVLPNGAELIGKTLGLRAEEIGGARILNHHIIASE
ncbi:MAG: hypothetical protein ACC628_05170 [Pirellulaceae bacterium]